MGGGGGGGMRNGHVGTFSVIPRERLRVSLT